MRIGAIYPDDAWVDVEAAAMVEDFCRFIPAGTDLVSAATPIAAEDATVASAVRFAENGDIEESARRLDRYDPDCFAYYCTTMSFIRGPGGDRDISDRITTVTGKPATTTSTAMIKAFEALGISKVVLASPYMSDVEVKFRDFIEAHGVTVLKSRGLGLPDGHSVVPQKQICDLARSVDITDAEALFVGCTGQRLALQISDLEEELGKPVLTANQVTGWHALRLIGVQVSMKGRGRLFEVAP